MTERVLEGLLEGNRRHVESLAEDHFADVQTGQSPAVVTVCCADSRVPQVGMWGTGEPGRLFTPSNIGNQVIDDADGELVVDGSLLYPIYHAGTDTVTVVGHTGCGAITAAYGIVTGDDRPGPRGVDALVDRLVPIVEDGLASDRIDTDTNEGMLINQLVEYNVDRQIAVLKQSEDVPDDVHCYGFVYDFQGIYGDDHGRAYLVNRHGETDPDEVASELPEEFQSVARSLLQ